MADVLGQLLHQKVFIGGEGRATVGPPALRAIGENHNQRERMAILQQIGGIEPGRVILIAAVELVQYRIGARTTTVSSGSKAV